MQPTKGFVQLGLDVIAKFKDGRDLSFGTTFNWEYFDLPENYCADEILEIINNSYLLKT